MWSTYVLVLLCVWVWWTGTSAPSVWAYGLGHDWLIGPPQAPAPPPPLPTTIWTQAPVGRITGSWIVTQRRRRIQAYRQVYYANEPVGSRRFQRPTKFLQNGAEIDGRQDGVTCPQPSRSELTEDCLTLNIYTPGDRSFYTNPYPVIVYLHGGWLQTGSARSDVAGPHYLLDRNLVLVTVNYRLGPLGFLSTGDGVIRGNNGFMDQLVAMQWVKDNIRAFGGDPNLITLAGSYSVGLHLLSPLSEGLFHRALLMGPSPVSQVEIKPHQRYLAERQAHLLGCPTHTSAEILDCLNKRGTKEIDDSLEQLFDLKSRDPILLWNAVIDREFLTEQPLVTIRQGRMNAVPLMVTQTRDELFWKAFIVQDNKTLLDDMNSNWESVAPKAFMLPEINSKAAARRLKEFYFEEKPIANDTASTEALGKLYSDAAIGFGIHRLANLMCRHSPHAVYYSEFAYLGGQSRYHHRGTTKPVGVAHGDDLLYVLTSTATHPMIPENSDDNIMVQKMTAIWYNFARFGDPNPKFPTAELENLWWPPMTPTERKYLRIDKNFSVGEKLKEERFKIWDQLYPIHY